MPLLVITDAVKTIMMLIGLVVIIRFMKGVFATKHAESSIKQFDAKKKAMEQEKQRVERAKGKITVSSTSTQHADVEDVDFEEVK
jgi:uncharacterized membrane protein